MNADAFWHRIVDSGQPPLLLPDIGTFFNQDIQGGEALVRAIMDAGIRCIKGEILHDADICLDTATQERFLGWDGKPLMENYRRLIERKVVSLADYERLFRPAREAGLGLCLSVYDFAGVDFALGMGVAALKIASTNLVHVPLIRYAAASGLPLILDTGKATLDEVWRAVDWAREAGGDRLILEYSPPAPPAPAADHNLAVLKVLSEAFDGPVSLSDHHAGNEALYAATALGCRVLEKGVCQTQQADDQDVYHALPVDQLADVRQTCATIHQLLGQAEAAYQAPTQRSNARMGLVAARDLEPGDVLEARVIRFAFPTLGILVEDWDRVVNRAVIRQVSRGQPLEWSDVVVPASS